MGLLQSDKVVFYHPLDNSTEHTQTQAWTASATYPAGKVSNAAGPVVSTSPAYGSEKAFYTTAAIHETPLVAALDSTKAVIVYRESSSNRHGRSRVATVSGTDITLGPESIFRTVTSDQVAPRGLAALDSTHVVVIYTDYEDHAYDGTAKVGTVSGTDITWGAEADYDTGVAYQAGVGALSATKFIVAWRRSGDSTGQSRVGTVSGADITWGATVQFETNLPLDLHVAGLTATTALLVYRDTDVNNQGEARIGTVSGTDVTWGASNIFESVSAIWTTATVVIAPTKILVAYMDDTQGTARVGTVSGTDITWGAEHQFQGNTDLGNITIDRLDSTHVIFAWLDQAPANHGVSRVATISGNDITFGVEVEFEADGPLGPWVSALTSGLFMIVYGDTGDSTHGKAIVGQFSNQGSLTASTPAAYPSAAAATRVAFCGWLKDPS